MWMSLFLKVFWKNWYFDLMLNVESEGLFIVVSKHNIQFRPPPLWLNCHTPCAWQQLSGLTHVQLLFTLNPSSSAFKVLACYHCQDTVKLGESPSKTLEHRPHTSPRRVGGSDTRTVFPMWPEMSRQKCRQSPPHKWHYTFSQSLWYISRIMQNSKCISYK